MRPILMLTVGAVLCCAQATRAQDYDQARLVDHWYRHFLGRAPDPGGNVFWVGLLRDGRNLDEVLSGLLGSDEYYAKCGSTPEGFVQTLLIDVIGRRPNDREMSYWIRRMYTETRAEVAAAFLAQYPGAWVGTFRLPDRERDQYRDREHERERERLLERERERERERHHENHDYRRPIYPFRR